MGSPPDADDSESSSMEYVHGEYIVDNTLEERAYQTKLVNEALGESTLIALPTGTGKTVVAARLAAKRLGEPGGMVLMLAPTQPLVNQHASFFREVLEIPDHEIKVFTGDVRPDKREEYWEGATSIVIATPQVIENDLIGNRYSLENVCHIVFDECHRATGDYAYTYIGERYHGNANNPLATGLSASPGASKDKIVKICSNLGLTNVDVLTEEDELLKEHLHDTNVQYKWIDIPDEILEARDMVQEVYVDRLKTLKNDLGVLNSARKDLPVRALMSARGKIQEMMDNDDSRGYKAQSVHAEALKLNHGWRTIETQSADAALRYFEKIIEEGRSSSGSKAAERIASSPRIQHAISKLRDFDSLHPKLSEVRVQVAQTLMNGGKVLVFTESRDTASRLVDFLDDGKIDPVRFVGQNNKQNDPGMTQKQQQETIQAFRDGEYNVLISTSVAEEGIDIPEVDLVLFYEPVHNAIRTVQRRGRTGRQTEGKVVILVGKETNDEAAYYISQRREEKMKEQLKELKEMEDDLRSVLREQQSNLSEFGKRDTDDETPVVYVDSRETKSSISKQLDRIDGVKVKLKTLEVADYVVSDRVGIERKELDDFIDSLTGGDRDVFEQVSDLISNYSRPVVIVEGGQGVESLFGRSQVSEEAIRSALLSLTIDFNVSLLFTTDEEETTKTIRSLARREQKDRNQPVNPHANKSSESMSEVQEYVVSSIPDVGPVIATALLRELGSPVRVLTASEEELKAVEGVGEATAEQIIDVASTTYDE